MATRLRGKLDVVLSKLCTNNPLFAVQYVELLEMHHGINKLVVLECMVHMPYVLHISSHFNPILSSWQLEKCHYELVFFCSVICLGRIQQFFLNMFALMLYMSEAKSEHA